jgi:hypothetical protein
LHLSLAVESWFSFLKQSEGYILIMDALLDVSTKDGKRQTIRVTVPDVKAAPPSAEFRSCKSQPTPKPAPLPPQEE